MRCSETFDISAQLFKSAVTDRNTKIASSNIFELVTFIEDHGPGLGQNSSIGRVLGLLLDREIGKEQVMIDDDDVAFHRFAMHFGDEAAVPGAAFLPQTSVGAGVNFVPERAGFRERCEFGTVSSIRYLLPRGDSAVVLDLLQSAKHGLVGKVVELLPAQIVIAPLHVTDLQLAFAVGKKRLFEKRDILMEKLFLKILGSGGNDDSLAGTNDGHQVGQRLARSSAGFDDQVTLFFQRLLDSLRHLQLPAAKFVGGMGARKHSARSEELVERDIAFLRVGGRRHKVTIMWGGHSCPPLLKLILGFGV